MTSLAESRSSVAALELAARVHELAETVAEHRSRFDSEGRLPDHLFEQLVALGLFRLLLPTSLGGQCLSALEFMDVVEAAAALDGTIGWLVGNGGGMARAGGYLPAVSARDLRRSVGVRGLVDGCGRTRGSRAGRILGDGTVAIWKRVAARHVVRSDLRGRGRRASHR